MQALPPSPRPSAALPAPEGTGSSPATATAPATTTGTAPAEGAGLIPSPRNAPVGGWQPRVVPPARNRTRAALPLDAVVFTAACPACGNDCEWSEQREDTRLRASVLCPCDAA